MNQKNIIKKTLGEMIEDIKEYPCDHIVFTWWEPALFEKQIKELQDELWYRYTYEIETNWGIELKNHYDQVNVSYKTSNSWNPKYELRAISDKYNYKFVVADEKDFKVEEIIQEYELFNNMIYLMPLWVTEESQNNLKVAQYCLEHWYQYCQRMHIVLFWNKRWV